MNRRSRPMLLLPTVAAMTVCLLPSLAAALINAFFQPVDVYARHLSAVTGQVQAVDAQAGSFTVRLDAVHKGAFKSGQSITIVAGGDMKDVLAAAVREGALKAGSRWVGFAGKKLRRHEKEFLFYTELGFGLGEMESRDKWLWDKSDMEAEGIDGATIPTLGGTWCGSVEMLERLLGDTAAGTAHFPRRAYCRFLNDLPLLELPKPVRGVALYDVDGDGRLDIYASCEAGDRLLMQVEPEKPDDPDVPAAPVAFADATEYVGLEGLASASCCFADVNADGRADLLADGAIYLAGEKLKNRFARSNLLPAEAAANVKASTFADINGDGWPDVVIARSDGGLRVYLNPADKGGPFANATKASGLHAKECGAELTGFFAVGDWNGDGRTDLFFAAGEGLLLVQDDKGVFRPVKHDAGMSFTSGESQQPGLTGAGVFVPLLDFARLDLLVPTESEWVLVTNRDGEPKDITGHGGEISEGSYLHLATIAEDLNLDGYLDLYTVSRAENGHNRLLINRGYGMFMHASKNPHYEVVFPGEAHQRGGWGVAAGDVDGDGGPDLLIGNAAGELVLLLNETLALRKPEENPIDDVKRLLEVRLLTVRVTGRLGVLGATVTLADDKGKLVARRDIGANVATGCRGPDCFTLAVRQGGKYALTVRYSDGHSRKWDVDLTGRERVVLDARREGPATAPSSGPASSAATAR